MDLVLTWWILLSCLIKQVHLESHLSKQEFAILAMDKNPKCFTRDRDDFTCFWEAPVGKSYYFLYIINQKEKRCDVKQQIYEEKDLYVCTFPSSGVFLFIDTQLIVIDRDTNTTVYNRTVNVENQHLLYPPSNISLHLTGEVGQLLVKWKKPLRSQYEIRYSSKHTSSTVRQVPKHPHKLVSLIAGENCTVQVRAKPRASNMFWSDWSSPVTAMVPQTAGDIELRCHTPDLSQALCKWRGELYDDGRYSFHYRQMNRSSWDIWKLCSKDNNTVHQCVLNGQESSVYQFYLSAGLEPYGRTFYEETFRMNSSIKTRPPGGLKAKPEERRLCLTWDPPFLKISQYLKYQIRYQRKGDSEWKDFTALSSKTSTCLDVHRGSQYTIQVRAQPNGSVYSGDWSDWSKPLTVLLPLDKEWIFIVCIPVALLIIASAMISFFSRYFRKVKKSLWPSVPNLNKVLESFLDDISGSHWEPTFNIKQCDDDTATSVVEILPEREATVKPCRKSTCLSPSERGFLSGEKNGENCREDLEMAQDYVILNNDKIPCFTGNDYVYRDVALSHVTNEKLHSCPSTCSTTFPECSTNILNHSYLLLAEQSDLEEYHSVSRQYTNMEITASVE
ncbi:thrombopoietin receptor [Rhinichthys klamathensis goyatoka]|uniref:thrombopoietin receptor n=1 Tax=Rhinichthys klamathensis goyatoka TaxID=3034132 RepID=UPI0024B555D8|nr:thrombopoietin receptor [Rhinichthys klamathensis goyatoka]